MRPAARAPSPRPVVRLLLSSLLVVGVPAALPASAAACSCTWLGEAVDIAAAAAEEADVAFIGQVVSTRSVWFGVDGAPATAYAFQVDRGSVALASSIEVVANDDEAICGFSFGLGHEWFVTANARGPMLQAGLCGSNLRLDRLDADEREAIEALVPIRSHPGEPVAGGPLAGLPIPAIGLTLALVAAAGVLLLRSGTSRPR